MKLTKTQEWLVAELRGMSDRERGVVLGHVVVIVGALASLSSKSRGGTLMESCVRRLMSEVNDIGIAVEYLEGEKNGSVS